VLKLTGKTYTVRGEYTAGVRAESTLLKGFAVDVSEVFNFVNWSGNGHASFNGNFIQQADSLTSSYWNAN
jgi:hypothetical protein